ncbi:MAG: hypothetical protein B6D65_00385 [candidate division Zixibacteria bacterium 4484_93]|nr:MAG: hypothetical protein B6D65_00385 [candidate division Zixibacteria bacterium 4484_93]
MGKRYIFLTVFFLLILLFGEVFAYPPRRAQKEGSKWGFYVAPMFSSERVGLRLDNIKSTYEDSVAIAFGVNGRGKLGFGGRVGLFTRLANRQRIDFAVSVDYFGSTFSFFEYSGNSLSIYEYDLTGLELSPRVTWSAHIPEGFEPYVSIGYAYTSLTLNDVSTGVHGFSVAAGTRVTFAGIYGFWAELSASPLGTVAFQYSQPEPFEYAHRLEVGTFSFHVGFDFPVSFAGATER